MGRPIEHSDRIGEFNYTRYGTKMIIIEYINCDNIKVKIDNTNYTIKTSYSIFKKGNVKYPYDKSVYNVGYFGEGKYNSSKDRRCYYCWRDMIRRCYDKKVYCKEPTYKGCTVCKEWLNFQNFAEWYYNNYYDFLSERVELDKDILNKHNKIYSPNNCIFVPQRINKLFKKVSHGNCKSLVVTYYKYNNKYNASCCVINNKGKALNKNLGYFSNEIDAFNAYKQFKEKYIKQVADDYKDKIPKKLYEAMYNWEVEITD